MRWDRLPHLPVRRHQGRVVEAAEKEQRCQRGYRGRPRRRFRAVVVWYLRMAALATLASFVLFTPGITQFVGAVATVVTVLAGVSASCKALNRSWTGVTPGQDR